MFDAIALGKEESVKFYTNWVNYVKETVPPSRLLIFEPKQGWEPLCKFLNKPIPEEPFPHVNDTSSMLWNFKKLKIISYTTLYVIPMLLSAIAGFWMFS